MINLPRSLSAAIRGYMRYYMPTSIAVDLLRTPRGLKWAVPVGLVAVPAYLYAHGSRLCCVVRSQAMVRPGSPVLIRWPV